MDAVGRPLQGLEGDNAERARALLRAGEFFWLDVDLDSADTERLGSLLDIPDHVVALMRDDRAPAFDRRYVDEERVTFPFTCIGHRGSPAGSAKLDPMAVNVLVHGRYVVTAHRGPCEPLREFARVEERFTRSAQHLIYGVLEQMVSSVFESLGHLERQTEAMARDVSKRHLGRRRLDFVHHERFRLMRLRGQLAPQLAVFENVSDEIPAVKGLNRDRDGYFVSIRQLLAHAVDAVDATDDALAGVLDWSLNLTNFFLTVVAATFLPLTFLTGFFGQNFNWFISQIGSAAAFFVFGLGLVLLSVIGSIWVIRRQLGPRLPKGALDPDGSSPRPGDDP